MAMNELTGRDLVSQAGILRRSGFGTAADILDHMLLMDGKSLSFLSLRASAAKHQDLCAARQGWTSWCTTNGVTPGTDEYRTALDKLLAELDRGAETDWMGALFPQHENQNGG